MSENLNDLRAFIIVTKAGSFTKAAGQMGISQSALSYTIKTLEERMGIKLLNRTTRSISPTQAGEQLFNDIEPLINGIEKRVSSLNEFRDSPIGSLRVNGTEHAISFLLWDKLVKFAKDYPDINLELTTDYMLSDIVKERYDIGIRLGNQVDKDMIAVQVTPPLEMITVASPFYIKNNGAPENPFELRHHRCIGLRLPTHDKIMEWDFKEKNGNIISPKIDFSMIVSHARLKVKAAVDDIGITWLPKTMIVNELESGLLVPVLEEWAMSYEGYYMYYPSRRESSPLFRLLVDALKLNK